MQFPPARETSCPVIEQPQQGETGILGVLSYTLRARGLSHDLFERAVFEYVDALKAGGARPDAVVAAVRRWVREPTAPLDDATIQSFAEAPVSQSFVCAAASLTIARYYGIQLRRLGESGARS
jgi:hypothetical protein